jgi:hypothetical protein
MSIPKDVTPITPTPKVITGGVTGIIAGFIMYELTNRLHIVIAPEEAVFISTILSFLASYLAPHSEPTPAQVAEIKSKP